MITNYAQRREKYTRQSVPRRLGNLSSNLNRIATYSDGSFCKESIFELIRESQYFAEWTIADTPLEIILNLVEMQRQLARWKVHWDKTWEDPEQKLRMQHDAKQWSDKLIDWMEAVQAP
jgi:hypothetical protein